MRIVLTADHAGVDLKDELAAWLSEQGHDVLDLGAHDHESVDYPRYGVMLAEALADGRAERGITVCGSGIGVAIAANRNPACRCAQVAEIALGARLIGIEMAKACVAAFIGTEFAGGRHQRRVDQLSKQLQDSD
jgi:ribose 5-phosphate isomerase B